jgi:hypothetical protein
VFLVAKEIEGRERERERERKVDRGRKSIGEGLWIVVWSEVKAWTELLKEMEEERRRKMRWEGEPWEQGKPSQQARCPSLAQQHSLGLGWAGTDWITGRTAQAQAQAQARTRLLPRVLTDRIGPSAISIPPLSGNDRNGPFWNVLLL